MNSPFIDNIEVNKYGRVRRARIFYFRGLTGKKARIQERRIKFASTTSDKAEKIQEQNVQEG